MSRGKHSGEESQVPACLKGSDDTAETRQAVGESLTPQRGHQGPAEGLEGWREMEQKQRGHTWLDLAGPAE